MEGKVQVYPFTGYLRTKLKKQELKESEEKFRTVVETTERVSYLYAKGNVLCKYKSTSDLRGIKICTILLQEMC